MSLVINDIMAEGKVISIEFEDFKDYNKVSVLINHVGKIISFKRNKEMDTMMKLHVSALLSSS